MVLSTLFPASLLSLLCLCSESFHRNGISLGRRKAFRAFATTDNRGPGAKSNADTFNIVVLGDLHLNPFDMEDHIRGRDHFKNIVNDKHGNPRPNTCVVSLGDLGESRPVHPGSKEIFSGTTECFELSREYLDGFGVPFEVAGGNHDLEGIDEFPTDQTNLDAYLRILGKETAQFKRLIAPRTMLIGLGSTVFREARYTSHEVIIDDAQVQWFEDTVKECPASEGWKVFVFSHAPPMGSGLRVLQENHVINGCCWLNHSGKNCRKFIEVVRENLSIKAWFSGHFHIGHDYQDSITFPLGQSGAEGDTPDGRKNNRGSCIFVQTACMSEHASRDNRQQSRVLKGNNNGFSINTVDHKTGRERIDVSITYVNPYDEQRAAPVAVNAEVDVSTLSTGTSDLIIYAHNNDDFDHDKFFAAYTPEEEDGCYIEEAKDDEVGENHYENINPTNKVNINNNTSKKNRNINTKENSVCWWHMSDGKVLGVHNGMVLEYDHLTLAPLGLVVCRAELKGRYLAIVDSGIEVDKEKLKEALAAGGTAPKRNLDHREQAIILYDDDLNVTVVQPNEDGSYWRKIVRNKNVRMKEVRREEAAIQFIKNNFKIPEWQNIEVKSSWGPYTTTAGTAKHTAIPGQSREETSTVTTSASASASANAE